MTTFDYCFRYDADCHWLARTFPPLEWRPVRRAVGRWLLGSENLIRWSRRLGLARSWVTRRPDVVVDVFIPLRTFADFFDWYASGLAHWPLWIVPYRVGEPYPWIEDERAAGIAGELMIDCAVYGKRNNGRAVDWSQAIEAKTYELGGIKTLISATTTHRISSGRSTTAAAGAPPRPSSTRRRLRRPLREVPRLTSGPSSPTCPSRRGVGTAASTPARDSAKRTRPGSCVSRAPATRASARTSRCLRRRTSPTCRSPASGRSARSARTSTRSTSGPRSPSGRLLRRFRNWAYESAALDLALAQAGRPLHDVLGREPRPSPT